MFQAQAKEGAGAGGSDSLCGVLRHSNEQNQIMSHTMDFTATSYKNSCAGRPEISTGTAKNNHMKRLEGADSPEMGFLESWRQPPVQSTIPSGGKPPQPLAVAKSYKSISRACSHISDRPINLSGLSGIVRMILGILVQIVCRQCALSAALDHTGTSGWEVLQPTPGKTHFIPEEYDCWSNSPHRKGKKPFRLVRILTIKHQDKTGFRHKQ